VYFAFGREREPQGPRMPLAKDLFMLVLDFAEYREGHKNEECGREVGQS